MDGHQMPAGWLNINRRNRYRSMNFPLIPWQVDIKIPKGVRAEMPRY